MEILKKLNESQFKNIQGLIISGYAKLPYAEYQFLTIHDTELAKKWLQLILPQITTAHRPEDEHGKKKRPHCALNIAFTYQGIKKFGLTSATGFSQEFLEGIAEPHRSRRLGDNGSSAPEQWDIHEKDIHMLLIIQAPNQKERDIFSANLQSLHQQHELTIIKTEYGLQPENNREHFGFTDSISQPFIENSPATPKGEQSLVKAGEFILGYHNEYEHLPPTPTIPVKEDPDNHLATVASHKDLKDFGYNGTYLVFRKLYQDVAMFNHYLELNIPDPAHRALVAAKFVGRWPSGTSLVDAPLADKEIENKNSFYFMNNDAKGLSCPISSHIRRTNPRDSLGFDPAQSLKTVNRHRLLRRGIQYGTPFAGGTIDDGKDRGILFLCINADIKRQFEFVQQSWINNPKFGGSYNDRDPITGNNMDPANEDSGNDYQMTIPGIVRQKLTGIPRFVQVKGGGYFFLPAIPALKYLASAG